MEPVRQKATHSDLCWFEPASKQWLYTEILRSHCQAPAIKHFTGSPLSASANSSLPPHKANIIKGKIIWLLSANCHEQISMMTSLQWVQGKVCPSKFHMGLACRNGAEHPSVLGNVLIMLTRSSVVFTLCSTKLALWTAELYESRG